MPDVPARSPTHLSDNDRMPLIPALHSVGTIRRMERTALDALPAFTLMQRAGAAAAALATELLAAAPARPEVLVLAGPGNNGGDALEAAWLLARNGRRVSLLLTGDPARLPADAAQAWQHARSADMTHLDIDNLDAITGTDWSLVIDGLFGIGLTRAITEPVATLIRTVNRLDTQVLALDVPSGLDADTGVIVGAPDGCAIEATHTITFIADKPGLHTGDGRDHAGEVRVAELGIASAGQTAHMTLNDVRAFAEHLQPRRHNTHKGSYGDVAVLGGARGMTGAAMLAARCAAMLGAGRVFVAAISDDFSLDPLRPEIMWRLAREIDYQDKTLILGTGLGTTREAHNALVRALATDAPAVLDADAFNLIAEESGLQKKLRGHRRALIVTPHPLEAARLLKSTTREVQNDRIAAARTLASRLHATVILKGSGSVIATPEGNVAINPTGNPALATAGAGDVLSGVCGALLAQGWPAWEAALAATWMHGAAADQLVARGIGPVGLLAGELIPEIRSTFNRLIASHAGKRLAR